MTIGATGSEDAWQRVAFVEVATSSTVKLQYEAMTETIDIDTGERDLDIINLINLGQIPKHGSLGLTTITFEGYPLQAGTADTSGATRGTPSGGMATGYFDVFASVQNVDSSSELDIDISNTLSRYRVAILWTDEAITTGTTSAASNATPSITAASETSGVHDGKRIRMTSGAADGADYMIVSNDATSVYTLTSGDTPQTDMGGAGPTDTFSIFPTGSCALQSGSKGFRFVLADCICTSCKTSFTDGIMKQTLVFKGRAFAKNGTRILCKMESCTSSDTLSDLGNYTPGTTAWA